MFEQANELLQLHSSVALSLLANPLKLLLYRGREISLTAANILTVRYYFVAFVIRSEDIQVVYFICLGLAQIKISWDLLKWCLVGSVLLQEAVSTLVVEVCWSQLEVGIRVVFSMASWLFVSLLILQHLDLRLLKGLYLLMCLQSVKGAI